MKNLFKTLVVAVACLCLTPNALQAQEKTAGLGLAYGTEIESLGIQLNGQYFLTENWAITPSFVYFLPKEAYQDYKMKWFEINLNGSYYFNLESQSVRPYATGGINITMVSVPVPNFDFFSGTGEIENETYSEVGLSIGGGADFMVSDNLIPFGELRYSLSDWNQLVIAGGVRISF